MTKVTGSIAVNWGGTLGVATSRPIVDRPASEQWPRTDLAALPEAGQRTTRRPKLGGVIYTVRITRLGGSFLANVVGAECAAGTAELPDVTRAMKDAACEAALREL